MRKRLRLPTPATVAGIAVTGLVLWRVGTSINAPSGATVEARERVLVQYVLDGDTIELHDGWRVRLLGVDTPELGSGDDPAEAGAEASRDWLQERIEGETVDLRYGPERLDRYGRTLAWVYLVDGGLINRMMLQEGQARLVTRYGLPGDLSEDLHRAAAQARAMKRGIWQTRPSGTR